MATVDLQSSVALHRRWISEIRAIGKRFGASVEIDEAVVPVQEIKDDLLVEFLNNYPNLLWVNYSQRANPNTMAACLWHYAGRDVILSLKNRGYEPMPALVLNDGDERKDRFRGNNVLLQLPRQNSDHTHIGLAIDLLIAKRDRTERLAKNTAESVDELNDRIERYKQWMAGRKRATVKT